jgi:hypothetical protein
MLQSADAKKRAVIRVGEGRGFVVKSRDRNAPERLVITAAHCLPGLPNVLEGPYGDRTYKSLLGRLGRDLGYETQAADSLLAGPRFESLHTHQ